MMRGGTDILGQLWKAFFFKFLVLKNCKVTVIHLIIVVSVLPNWNLFLILKPPKPSENLLHTLFNKNINDIYMKTDWFKDILKIR